MREKERQRLLGNKRKNQQDDDSEEEPPSDREGQESKNTLQDMMKDKEKRIESYMDEVTDFKKEKDHEFVSKLITAELSQKLFTAVREFLAKRDEVKQREQEQLRDIVNEDGMLDNLDLGGGAFDQDPEEYGQEE